MNKTTVQQAKKILEQIDALGQQYMELLHAEHDIDVRIALGGLIVSIFSPATNVYAQRCFGHTVFLRGQISMVQAEESRIMQENKESLSKEDADMADLLEKLEQKREKTRN